MLRAALAAQAMGAWIFPVAANDKVPHRLAGQWGTTATNDMSRIFHFWSTCDPFANIGIACKPSQLLVVDLDQAKEDWNLVKTEWAYLHSAYGPRVSGEDLFDEMRFAQDGDGAGNMPDTYAVRTCRGGLHLYYWWPAHWPRISQASPVKGVVDVRGNAANSGGYVLAPGSRAEGGEYKIETDVPPVLPPEWIRKLVAEKPKPPSTRRPAAPGAVSIFSHHGLIATVQNAAEGNRNNSLVWAARTMCEEGVPESEAMRILGQAASNAGLGDAEIERTVQSAYRTQQYKDGGAR